jgi:murein DD-endopeptidase MepM/ murein hydrolase activator NlpD
MLEKFKFRLLLVLILVTACFLLMQNAYYRQVLQPVLFYVMRPNDMLEEAIGLVFDGRGGGSDAGAAGPLTAICDYEAVLKPFGWTTGADGQEVFCNGVYLDTLQHVPVCAVVSGRVEKILLTETTLGALLQGEGLTCFYSGLETLVVEEGQEVAAGSMIGYSGAAVYFEMRDGTGAINPAYMPAGK